MDDDFLDAVQMRLEDLSHIIQLLREHAGVIPGLSGVMGKNHDRRTAFVHIHPGLHLIDGKIQVFPFFLLLFRLADQIGKGAFAGIVHTGRHDHRRRAPGHRRPCARFPDAPDPQGRRAVTCFIQVHMRVGMVPADHVSRIDHLFRHIGVQIGGNGDDRLIPHRLPDGGKDAPYPVIRLCGLGSAVAGKEYAVHGLAVLDCFQKIMQKILKDLMFHQTAALGMHRDGTDGLPVRFLNGADNTAQGVRLAGILHKDIVAPRNACPPEVFICCIDRAESVGFLHEFADNDLHFISSSV